MAFIGVLEGGLEQVRCLGGIGVVSGLEFLPGTEEAA